MAVGGARFTLGRTCVAGHLQTYEMPKVRHANDRFGSTAATGQRPIEAAHPSKRSFKGRRHLSTTSAGCTSAGKWPKRHRRPSAADRIVESAPANRSGSTGSRQSRLDTPRPGIDDSTCLTTRWGGRYLEQEVAQRRQQELCTEQIQHVHEGHENIHVGLELDGRIGSGRHRSAQRDARQDDDTTGEQLAPGSRREKGSGIAAAGSTQDQLAARPAAPGMTPP